MSSPITKPLPSGQFTATDHTSFLAALQIQMRVIGALILRELHTRYGRENIGYLWLIAEPMMLGSVVAALHAGQKSHEGINPVTFTVTGYCIFIIFRGIVSRSDGTLEANAPLLYHKMVTVFDLTVARSILEVAGCVTAFMILLSICIALNFGSLPARPLYLMLGIFYVSTISFAFGMIVTGGTYEKPTLGRLVHPIVYFMIPLSGAFYQVAWIPQPYRDYLLYLPLPPMFEIVRYGQFASANLDYVDFEYINAMTMAMTLAGLIAVRSVRSRIQLA